MRGVGLNHVMIRAADGFRQFSPLASQVQRLIAVVEKAGLPGLNEGQTVEYVG
jgi:hypothetical protein